jgi:WhiB family redox-sensing transcriptional regulator
MKDVYAVAQTVPNEATEWSGMSSLIDPEPWMQDASCAQVGGDAWFPEGRGSHNEDAIKICGNCPAREACLEYALRTKQRHGIWGGLTPNQRTRLTKKRAS